MLSRLSFGNNRPHSHSCRNSRRPTPKSKSNSASRTFPAIRDKIQIPRPHAPNSACLKRTPCTTRPNLTSAAVACSCASASKPRHQKNNRATRGERVILTSKAPPHLTPRRKPRRYKERAERELVVKAQSSRQYAAALTSLGFRPAFRYDKYRTTFRLPNLHLDLDETPAGTFLELEGKPQAIDRAAKALGFAKKAYLRVTYWDLYVADCRRRGSRPKNMLFRAK